jgi:A/G-specific adenine glycosylase
MKTALPLHEFKNIIWSYYSTHGRIFDWRHTDDPYKVFISEVMLQQTQTARVAQKFPQFISAFPDFKSLANALLKEVLLQWQGLGYNRRGMYLQQAAQIIMQEYAGILPNDPEVLVKLPGIGKATAASICAFAFNYPTIFIETNIRAVFIHFFFQGKDQVHDNEIMPLVQASLEKDNARDWYYALMDYGVMLKKTLVNPSRKSKHHAKQSKFEGSDRQIRGMILRILTQSHAPISYETLIAVIQKDSERVSKIIDQMIKDKLLSITGIHNQFFLEIYKQPLQL